MLITSRKYKTKRVNGSNYALAPSDFAENLVGNVMQETQITTEVTVLVESKAQTNLPFDIDNTALTVKRTFGSFLDDGFRIGDRVNISTATGTTNAVIDIVAVTATQINYTLFSGTDATESQTDFILYLTSNLEGFQLKFGIIENGDTTSYNSELDNVTTQGFYAENVQTTASVITCTPIGETVNKSWNNGSCTVEFKSYLAGKFVFEVVHETLIPYYLEGDLNNVTNSIPTDNFEGDKSLKYVADYEFSRVLTNPNSARNVIDDEILGSVGYFGEPFNGLNNTFSISNLTYEDISANPVDKIVADVFTRVKFRVTSTASSFSLSSKAGVYVSRLSSQEQYQNSAQTRIENFLFDSLFEDVNTVPTIPSPYVIQDALFTYVDANNIDCQVDVIFNGVEADENYLVALEIASDGATNTVSDKTCLVVAVDTFEKSPDIEGLFGVDSMVFDLYPDAQGTNAWTSVRGWIEDPLTMKVDFWLDQSLNAYLEELSAKIVAYNTVDGTWFELEEVPFPLNTGVVVSGTQTYNIDQARGFNFDAKGDYNILKLVNGSLVGSKQHYDLQLSLKMDWQNWIKLPEADTVFYDNSKPNDGLNENASNYSLANNYEIRILIDAQVRETTSNIITNYVTSNIDNEVYDYDVDENVSPEWSVAIETFDASGTLLGEGILDKGTTTIKATYTALSAISPSIYNIWVSLEPINSPGKNAIKIYPCAVTDNGVTVEGEYDLDPSEVDLSKQYKISSRMYCSASVCTPNYVTFATSYPTPNSGIWNMALGIFEPDTVTPLTTGVVSFKFKDGATVIYGASFNIGDNIASATPLTDTGTRAFSEIQADFSSTIIQNGATVQFDKKTWALANGFMDDDSGLNSIEFDVEFETFFPCSSNVATDTIGLKTYTEYYSGVTGMTASPGGTSILNTYGDNGTLVPTARQEAYNSSSAIYLNPTGALFNGANLVQGASPGATTQINNAGQKVNIIHFQTTAQGNALISRYTETNTLTTYIQATNQKTVSEGQLIDTYHTFVNTLGLTRPPGNTATVRVVKGGTVAIPPYAVPLAPVVTGGSLMWSLGGFNIFNTFSRATIPAGNYGTMHYELIQDFTGGEIVVLIAIFTFKRY